jgi:hypothetical protein
MPGCWSDGNARLAVRGTVLFLLVTRKRRDGRFAVLDSKSVATASWLSQHIGFSDSPALLAVKMLLSLGWPPTNVVTTASQGYGLVGMGGGLVGIIVLAITSQWSPDAAAC